MRQAPRGVLVLLGIAVLVAAAGGSAIGQRGEGVDVNGPYDPVPNWFKPIHEGTKQCVSGVAAESPNRIFLVTEVEVPSAQSTGCTPERYKPGAHSHNILVVDGTGKVIEDWSQWNNLFGFGHAIRFSPYDKEHVWVVNRDVHQVHKFTRDGKKLVMTLGWQLRHPGTDPEHFGMPADIAFLPDGTFFIADGYYNSRVVKFDKDGKYMTAWGTKGSGPGQFIVPHGVATDGQRRVYVADRDNARVQVFDEHGHYVDEWRGIHSPAHILATKDNAVWVMTLQTREMRKYDLNGKLLTKWGPGPGPAVPMGDFSGGHQFSVDSAGNLYVANFARGVLKFVPKAGADKSRLVAPEPF
jgi:DNA-binding beta-propeller fold protein YncE